MNRMRLGVSAGIIALIVIGAFALSVPHTRDLAQETPEIETPAIPIVTLREVYKKGTHTINGSLLVPDACTSVGATATLVAGASTSERIVVALTMPESEGICLLVPTRATFQTTLIAPDGLPLEVTVNGALASITPP